jgi:hypothetical protein
MPAPPVPGSKGFCVVADDGYAARQLDRDPRIEERQLDSSLRRTGDFRLRPVERPSALLGLAIDVSALTN